MREARAEKETIHVKTEQTTTTTANVAEQGANVAPEKPASKKSASKKKGAPKAKKGGKGAKPAKAPAKKDAAERTNKKAEVIAMMKRAKGVTLPEIVKPRAGRNTQFAGSLAS
jgi:hypothetical protein